MLPKVSAALIKYLKPLHSHKTQSGSFSIQLDTTGFGKPKGLKQARENPGKAAQKAGLSPSAKGEGTTEQVASGMLALLMLNGKRAKEQKPEQAKKAYAETHASKAKTKLFQKGTMVDEDDG